jgi:hypothetical protein
MSARKRKQHKKEEERDDLQLGREFEDERGAIRGEKLERQLETRTTAPAQERVPPPVSAAANGSHPVDPSKRERES